MKRLWSGACLGLALSLAAPASAQPEALPRIAAAVRSEVGGKLKTFYKARNYYPLWVEEGTIGPQADRLIELLETADVDGLDPRDYDARDLREAVERARFGAARDIAEAELGLSRALARYVRDMRRQPSVRMVYLDSEVQPTAPSEELVLRGAAVAPSMTDYVQSIGWMSPFYGRLRQALLDYREQWAGLPAVGVPPGPTLKAGSKGDRVRALRLRLGLEDGAVFDKAAAARVRAFQAAHGLPADGIAGARTITALNRSPADYERLIELNLERARALPSARDRHIVVDAAAARLWVYEDGEVVDTMKVIVGKPAEPTPMLAGLVRYAVTNPYWNVPPDLAARRIAPRILKGESLQRMGYEALSDWSNSARLLSQDEIDWAAVADGRQELRVRQLPGPSNSMGKMKFMFPNDLGIYLHDTPEKALFKKEDRRFSSGCVRLEDAPRLARWLFGQPLEAPSDEPEQHVYLPRPVPVYLTYFTAAPTEGGGIAFREDAYGRDGSADRQFAGR